MSGWAIKGAFRNRWCEREGVSSALGDSDIGSSEEKLKGVIREMRKEDSKGRKGREREGETLLAIHCRQMHRKKHRDGKGRNKSLAKRREREGEQMRLYDCQQLDCQLVFDPLADDKTVQKGRERERKEICGA